ncbi:MAG: VOC family protein [Coriobacteriales bacterium]|nr:VOC family protein [Coriobacteriales bacterium]
MDNVIVWCDIPCTDLERAAKFYAAVLQMPVNIIPSDPPVGLPGEPPDPNAPPTEGPFPVAFDLYVGKPSMEGVTVYIPAKGDWDGILSRIRSAGGEILDEPADLGQMVGTLAFFKDSEGNRIGIHEPPAM